MSSPSPRIARRPPAGPPVLEPLDALRVVLLAASAPRRPETVCLLLGPGFRPLACVVVVGHGSVVPIAETMLLVADPALGPGPPATVRAVVLATVRPGLGHAPDTADELDWHRMRASFDDAGIDLLDWFLVDGDRASSLAELTDSRSRWPGRPG